MVVIIWGKYGNNRSKTENVTERTHFFKVKVEWPWRYRSRSKVIRCNTPSHASDHLYQIWKESVTHCRWNRADTIFKSKAKWPWRYRSTAHLLKLLDKICKYEMDPACIVEDTGNYMQHPLMVMMICAKYGKNASRIVVFFQGESGKISKKLKFQTFVINWTCDTPYNGSDYLRQIWK